MAVKAEVHASSLGPRSVKQGHAAMQQGSTHSAHFSTKGSESIAWIWCSLVGVG